MKLSPFLKHCDIFGAEVGLHFGNWPKNEKERSVSYKTEIGGLFSLICIVLFFCALGTFSMSLFNKQENKIKTEKFLPDWQKLKG
jgi:hypothetical protein